MTSWGLILLVGYIALGLSPIDVDRAVKFATWLTVVVLLVVGVRSGAI